MVCMCMVHVFVCGVSSCGVSVCVYMVGRRGAGAIQV